MERKFTQPVAMPCTSDQYKELSPALDKMGYHNDAAIGTHYGYIATNGNGKADAYICIDEDLKRDFGRYVIPRYNPELFLALAAMSSGDEFWPEEWCVYEMTSYHHFKHGSLYKHSGNGMFRAENGWDIKAASPTSFRKATAEEIIAHFTKKEEMIEVDPDDIAQNRHLFEGKEIYCGQPMTRNEIKKCHETAKSFFDQISGEADTPDVPLSEKVDKMVEDLNGMADLSEKLLDSLKKCDEKIQECNEALDKSGIWIPRPGERVVGKLPNGKYCIGIYLENSIHNTRQYVMDESDDKIAWICESVEPAETVELSISELLAFYSQHTGTDLKLLKVKK